MMQSIWEIALKCWQMRWRPGTRTHMPDTTEIKKEKNAAVPVYCGGPSSYNHISVCISVRPHWLNIQEGYEQYVYGARGARAETGLAAWVPSRQLMVFIVDAILPFQQSIFFRIIFFCVSVTLAWLAICIIHCVTHCAPNSYICTMHIE